MKRIYSFVMVFLAVLLMLVPSDLFSQRGSRSGGSFGGSRSSGRSYSAPRSAPRSTPRSGGGSFGGSRSAPRSNGYSAPSNRNSSPSGTQRNQPYSTPRRSSEQSMQNSFGGTRLNSTADYTSRYGTPRRTETKSLQNGASGSNYVVHSYGGMSDGFMMGYIMGRAPWYYHMPFHPAFYYSAPYTVANPDGTTAVYPGQFNTGTLVFTMLLLGGGGYIVYVWYRNRKRVQNFGGNDMSQSSFG
ncbi:MAG: hypothetical protein HQ472_10005 [Ignavibacteria bacterium]|nr:hypothetical protein [Ignavibacteria bacterium]